MTTLQLAPGLTEAHARSGFTCPAQAAAALDALEAQILNLAVFGVGEDIARRYREDMAETPD